jgi:hypothetical protein
LKSIANFNGDLASLTAPPFILSPTSLVEYSQFWYADHELFTAAAREQDEEKRFLAVLRWFIGTLRGQYTSRNEKLGSEKKPLNPFLGEVFVGEWKDSGVVLASEQVSHHPPITGYALWSDKDGVYLDGYNGIKARIAMPTIAVKQRGHATYYLKQFDETYVVTLPALHIEGILFGSPYVELEGASYIESSTGYRAKIDYSGKGYFSGKKNSFTAKVTRVGASSKTLYTVKGQWSEESKLRDEATGTERPFLDARKTVTPELSVKPESEQHELESRRAWAKVAEAIRAGDFDTIHREKSKIENEQRQMRKDEAADGRNWKQRWFSLRQAADTSPVYQSVSGEQGDEIEDQWVFSRKLYDKDTEIKP